MNPEGLDERPNPTPLGEEGSPNLPVVVGVIVRLCGRLCREWGYWPQRPGPRFVGDTSEEREEQSRKGGDTIKVGTCRDDPRIKGVFRGWSKKELARSGGPPSCDLLVTVIRQKNRSLRRRRVSVSIALEGGCRVVSAEWETGSVGQKRLDLQTYYPLVSAYEVLPRWIDDIGNPIVEVASDIIASLDGVVRQIGTCPLEPILVMKKTD